MSLPLVCATSSASTSVSLDVLKRTPCCSRSSRSTCVFVRLPLWAIAMVPSCGCSTRMAGHSPAGSSRWWSIAYAPWPGGRQALERLLVEGLRDQAHVLVHPHGLAITGCDPGTLLPAVLQGIEPEIGQVGHVLTGRIDAKEPHSSCIRSSAIGWRRVQNAVPMPVASCRGKGGYPTHLEILAANDADGVQRDVMVRHQLLQVRHAPRSDASRSPPL